MVATTLLLSGAIAPFTPIAEVAAQDQGGQLRLVKDWIQRSHHEVAQSINEDLTVSDTYTIRWGDTLATIAQAMRMSVEEVASLNNISNKNLIIAGNVLRFNGTILPVATNEVAQVEVEEVEPVVQEQDIQVAEAYTNLLNGQVEEATELEEHAEAEVTQAVATETEVPTTVFTTEEVAVVEETTYTEPTYETIVTDMTAWEPAEETTPEVVETTEEYVETTEAYEETTEAYVETTEAYEETTEAYVETTEAYVETTEEVTQAPAPTTNLSAREAFNILTAEKGLTQSEIDGWAYIIERESGWNHTIANPSSGAYGLPQALPGNKMSSHGADWQTNPYTQLSWMYDYMVNRYGSIQGALNFWNANHWY